MKHKLKLNIILKWWDSKKKIYLTKRFNDYGTLNLFIEQKHLEEYLLNGYYVFRF